MEAVDPIDPKPEPTRLNRSELADALKVARDRIVEANANPELKAIQDSGITAENSTAGVDALAREEELGRQIEATVGGIDSEIASIRAQQAFVELSVENKLLAILDEKNFQRFVKDTRRIPRDFNAYCSHYSIELPKDARNYQKTFSKLQEQALASQKQQQRQAMLERQQAAARQQQRAAELQAKLAVAREEHAARFKNVPQENKKIGVIEEYFLLSAMSKARAKGDKTSFEQYKSAAIDHLDGEISKEGSKKRGRLSRARINKQERRETLKNINFYNIGERTDALERVIKDREKKLAREGVQLIKQQPGAESEKNLAGITRL